MSTTLLLLAQQNYQDVELAGTQKGLGGVQVTIASTEAGVCTGKFGGKATAALSLRDVRVEDYDRIAFIGGPGAEALKEDPEALRIVREAVKAGKPLGAICIAPLILAHAGILRGKKATVWDSGGEQIRELEAQGAIFSDEAVTRDGLIVTGNGATVAEEFGRVLGSL
ncbi:MAG: DJ-1/PfpI family protein [Candidatus Peribacteraceae bacterium]|jgi:protease I